MYRLEARQAIIEDIIVDGIVLARGSSAGFIPSARSFESFVRSVIRASVVALIAEAVKKMLMG